MSTVKRWRLAEIAGYGYCASHSRWYWGVKLYLVTTAHGMPIGWCLADPKRGAREVAIELIGHLGDQGLLPGQCVLIGDKGVAGKDFQAQAPLERHAGRTTAGPYARIAQRLLAPAAAI